MGARRGGASVSHRDRAGSGLRAGYAVARGVWHDRQAGVSLAYALNGLPLGDDSDALRQEELAILRALAAIVD